MGLLVLHSGDYFLFETDSEEDEESPVEDPKPPKQSAFQVRRGVGDFPLQGLGQVGAQVLLTAWDEFIGNINYYKTNARYKTFLVPL